MIQLFLGTNAFSKNQALEKALQKALGDSYSDPMAKQVFHGGDTEDIESKIIGSAATVSMFGHQTAVVVRRFDAMKAAEQAELLAWLKTQPDAMIFMEGTKIDGRTEFGKTIKKIAEVQSFDAPPAYKMAAWIGDYCQSQLKVRIQNNAAQYIADALGNDPALVHSELQKVLLHSPDCKEISLDLAKELIVPQREMMAYELQKPFGERNSSEFVKTLRELGQAGVSSVAIVSSLYQQCVRLLHVQAMQKEGSSEQEMAQVCGMVPWVFSRIQNLPAQARRWHPRLLLRVTARLSEINFEIMLGKYSTPAELENALYALVVR